MASTAMEDLGPPPPDAGSSFDVGTFKTYLASLLLPGGSESFEIMLQTVQGSDLTMQ